MGLLTKVIILNNNFILIIKEKSIYLYSRAAELGDKDALYVMGVMHEEGIHVPKSKHLAANYYQRAAELKQNDAKVNLAVLLMKKDNDDIHNKENLEDSQNTIVMERTLNRNSNGGTSKINQSVFGKPSLNHMR